MTKKEIKQFAQRLINESIVNGKIDEKRVATIVNIIDQVPYPFSRMILEEFATLFSIEKQKRTFTITSVHALEKKELDKITNRFRLDNMDFVETKIDLNLIAGVRVSNADSVLDLSMKREIENLRKVLQ